MLSAIRTVHIAKDPIDMRRSFDGLLSSARHLGLDPYAGCCVVFLSRSRVILKAVFGDAKGIVLVCSTEVRMLFDAIAMYERELTEAGRRTSNVLAVREKITGPLWEVILSQSQALADRWPRGHPIGKAARFVTNQFEKLTIHCEHPHMPDNNTLSERMLRSEKVMHRSSLFRWSLQGRGAWNIVRGIHQTCSLAGIDFRTYLREFLVADPSKVEAHPERFTPHAFALRNKS